MTTRWIYRADITGLDSSGDATVFRYATEGYCSTPAHATLPNTWFDGRLIQPLDLQRDLYGEVRTRGDADIAHGTTVLGNADGGLNALLAYGFDQQKIEIYRIDPAAPDTEYLEHRLFMESLLPDGDTIQILVRDATYLFDRALQSTKYAGSNSLPNGLEGTANDIKGQPKPMCWGVNFNLEPVLVNTSRLIYQFHHKQLGTGFSLAVYDRRVALAAGLLRPLSDFQNDAVSKTVSSIDTTLSEITFTAPHTFSTGEPVHGAAATAMPGGVSTSQYYYARATAVDKITLHPTAADASANTNKVSITSAGSGTITFARNRTPASCYDWCSDASGSYIRLGSSPARVTMDVTNPPSGGGNAWYDILSWILANEVGTIGGLALTLDNQVSSSYSIIGVYWKDEITVYEAIRQVVASVGASFQCYTSRTGPSQLFVTVQRLEVPGSTAVLELDENSIKAGTLRQIQPQDETRGIPAWRVTCRYKLNRTVMSGSDLAGASAADVAFTASEYRSVQFDTSFVKTQHPGAQEVVVDTLLTTESDATAHGNYVRGVCGPALNAYAASCSLELIDPLVTGMTPQIPGLVLGQDVKVTHPLCGLQSGKYLAVIGQKINLQDRTADLILWG